MVITFFILPIIILFKINFFNKIIIFIFSIFLIFISYIYGNYKINQNEKKLESINKKIFVKVISPNFDLKYGLDKGEIEERFKKLVRYSDPNKEKKTLFIWPEGVFSGYSYKDILSFKKIISKNFSEKHLIVFGVNKLDAKSGNFYNSMVITDNNLSIIQSYNQRKLVPFGEFLPFDNFLNNFGLKKITEGHGSFLKGNNNSNLLIDGISILPLICYEVIFTDLIQNLLKIQILLLIFQKTGGLVNQ